MHSTPWVFTVHALSGYLEDAPVRMWADFTARQKARHVPVSPDAKRRTPPASQGVGGWVDGGLQLWQHFAWVIFCYDLFL